MSKQRWTPEMIDKLRELRSQGKSLREIGEIYGVSGERIRQLIGNTGDVYYTQRTRTRKLLTKVIPDRNDASQVLGIDVHSVDRIRRNVDEKI